MKSFQDVVDGKMVLLEGGAGSGKSLLADHFATELMKPGTACAWFDIERSGRFVRRIPERTLVSSLSSAQEILRAIQSFPEQVRVIVLDGAHFMEHQDTDWNRICPLLAKLGRTTIITWGKDHVPKGLKFYPYLRLRLTIDADTLKATMVKNMFSAWLGHTVIFPRNTLTSLESLSGYGRRFDPDNPDSVPQDWEYL